MIERFLTLLDLARGRTPDSEASSSRTLQLAAAALLMALGFGALWGLAAGSSSWPQALSNLWKVPMVVLFSALTAIPGGLLTWKLAGAPGRPADLLAQFAASIFAGTLVMAVLAPLVAVMAIAMFIGAEKVEKIFTRRRNGGAEPAPIQRQPRRLAFGFVGLLSVVAVATLAVPTTPSAAVAVKEKAFSSITTEELARRVIDAPWTVRVLDLRARNFCEKRRVPGAECVPWDEVPKLGLAYASGARDLVLIYHHGLDRIPVAAAKYPGKILVAAGGCKAWRDFALTAPEAPSEDATAAEHETYRFRSALQSALTGRKAAPPPKSVKKFAPAPRKKKGGGCG